MQSVQYYSDLPDFVTLFLKQIKAILTLNVKGCLCSLTQEESIGHTNG